MPSVRNEAPKAPRGVRCEEGCGVRRGVPLTTRLPTREGSREVAMPLPNFFDF